MVQQRPWQHTRHARTPSAVHALCGGRWRWPTLFLPAKRYGVTACALPLGTPHGQLVAGRREALPPALPRVQPRCRSVNAEDHGGPTHLEHGITAPSTSKAPVQCRPALAGPALPTCGEQRHKSPQRCHTDGTRPGTPAHEACLRLPVGVCWSVCSVDRDCPPDDGASAVMYISHCRCPSHRVEWGWGDVQVTVHLAPGLYEITSPLPPITRSMSLVRVAFRPSSSPRLPRSLSTSNHLTVCLSVWLRAHSLSAQLPHCHYACCVSYILIRPASSRSFETLS